MSTLLDHYRKLPRPALQAELRRITGIESLHLWEYVGYNWMYESVRAGHRLANLLGVPVDSVIGYRVLAGHVTGGALGDLLNVVNQDRPPYPDPFR